jgi:ATP-dependent protease ClpP protease subunit
MTSTEAKKYGMIDDIITKRKWLIQYLMRIT